MKLLPIFMTLLAFFDTLKAKRLKILISSPTLGYSHMQFQGAIADALAKQGHEVHLLIFQGFPTPDANYTGSNLAQKVIKVAKDQTNDAIFKTDLMANPFRGPSNMILDGSLKAFHRFFTACCEQLLANRDLLAELEAEKYDVAVAEVFDLCMFGIFHKIGVKTKVSSYAITFVNLIGSNFGIPHFSSYITNMWAPSLNGPKMNFFERAYNFYTDLYENYKIRPLINQLEQPLFNSAFGDDFPLLSNIMRNVSFVFVNANPFFDLPKPLSNKIVYVGGIVEIDKKSLEQKFHKIFDRSKSGVILFSFGTFINASKMTHEMRNHFLSSFAEFPNYEFIWKFDEPQKDLPPNVHVFNWINQRTILAHPETKAFITHCGVNSINEAALNGVPVLCIPLLGDQYYNGAVVRHNELGVYLDILKLDKNSMNRSLKEVLDNPQYREKAQVLKQKLRLQPFSAKERLVKWVEFAAEFSELNELNLPCIDEMGVFVYYSLDVIAVALVLLVIITICSLFVVKLVFKKICERCKSRYIKIKSS